ncbi:unnamed protein product, partial [Effrenium voratum]
AQDEWRGHRNQNIAVRQARNIMPVVDMTGPDQKGPAGKLSEICTPSALSCASTGISSQVEEHGPPVSDALSDDQSMSTPRRNEASDKLTLPLGKRGVAWCDIHDDETLDDQWLPSPLEERKDPDRAKGLQEAENTPSKNKRKSKKGKDATRPAGAKTPEVKDAGYARQMRPTPERGEGPAQVTLGDLGLHCTAWNQAGAPAGWIPPQKAVGPSVMSTAPIEKRTPPVFLPQGALGPLVTSPTAAATGQPTFGDASSRRVCPGASPTVQFAPEATMRFIPAGSPMAATMTATTPKAGWDASCRTPVNTPMACRMPWPAGSRQGATPSGPWSPMAADALRVFFGHSVPSGERSWPPAFKLLCPRVMRTDCSLWSFAGERRMQSAHLTHLHAKTRTDLSLPLSTIARRM